MENKNETFNYDYSATQQNEVRKIRQKYTPYKENKIDQLHKLDKHAKRPGTIASITVGIIGTLLLGIGMCLTMVWTEFFSLGIIIGLIGIVGVSIAYFIFTYITKKQREKLAPQIMKLSDELLD